METEDFFVFIENRLKVAISEIIKAHLKFHNMDNFIVASTLHDRDIRKIEDFARNTLHQILRPEEMFQFYGTHFVENPRQFVFCLYERMVISDIKRVCQEISSGNRQYTEKNDLENVECGCTTSDYLRDTPKCDNCREWINMQVNFKKEEAVVDTFKDASSSMDTVLVNQDEHSRTVLYTNDIINFCPDSTEQRGVGLKLFGTIRKLFLAKNKVTKTFKR